MAEAKFYSYPTSVVHVDAEIDEGTSIWHFCHLMPGCKIGSQCTIEQNVFVDRNVIIGNRVKIQNNVSIYDGVIIEDDVFLGPSMVFTNIINLRSFIERNQSSGRRL